ncbi:hypothetical protein GF389_04230 [Candidatus Dojkabacteria bacterium]|nr:hypothetical protein [Candidatus Dojkabacteria bacterium]
MKKIFALTLFLFCFSFNYANAQYFIEIKLSKTTDGIVINEILANPEGSDRGNEWLEIYNYSSELINLSEWVLKDTSSRQFVFEDVTVSPKEFIVIYPNFALNQSNEEISLYDINGNLVDSFFYETSSEDLSWARVPDGIGDWLSDQFPTPGFSNAPVVIEYPDNIFITEIYPTPGEDEQEWLELFNNSEEEIDLDDWIIEDLSKSISLSEITIQPYEYLVLSEEISAITLNNSGDTIRLLNPNEELVHEFIYESTKNPFSNILYESTILQTKVPTPGVENIYVDPNDCFYDAKEVSVDEFKLAGLDDENYYKLEGTITAAKGQIYSEKIYVQDETGGLMIDLPDDYLESISIGENLSVCGYHDEYYQEDEFVIETAGAIVKLGTETQPVIYETETASKSFVGQLIEIEGEITDNSSSSITVKTPKDSLKVKLSHLNLEQDKSKGDKVEIIGILTRYGDTKEGEPYYRLVPRSETDITIHHTEKSSNTTKVKTLRSSAVKSSSSSSSIKGVKATSLNNKDLSMPIFQEKLDSQISAGIERETKEKDQTALRVIYASGFMVSGSSIFLLFGKQREKK